MSKLSPNFKRSEFACKCGCGFDTIDSETLVAAEVVRQKIGAYTPNSACRCQKYNKQVGGSKRSMHLFARALDIPYNNTQELYDYLDELYHNTYGIGIYDTFIHIDTREERARWDGRKKGT